MQQNQYYIQTFGCQMNDHDSQLLAGMLEELGYAPAYAPEEAGIILFNTCCVRGNAENRLYGHLGNFKPLKEANPHLILGVCGCLVQQPSEREKLEKEFPYVDLVIGTHNIHRLPILLSMVMQGQRTIEVWDDNQEGIPEDLPILRPNDHHALVTIMYGCNNFCSYCIVPHVRGRERSRKPEDIIREIQGLAEAGVREITLLGQNVNSYGQDLALEIDFSRLLDMVNEISGISRIRFTTSHPKDLSPALIQTMKDLDKVCEHLHLPVQSGSSRILQKMNRKYTREHYLELVRSLREAIPDIALTTDIIVGFPGESEEDFQETVSLVQEVGYDGAFTFVYSPRIGTAAAGYPDGVTENEKKDRLYRLNEVVNNSANQANQKLLGTVQKVLVEGPSEKSATVYQGRTRGNKLVHFELAKSAAMPTGGEVSVRIVQARTWTLTGQVIEEDLPG